MQIQPYLFFEGRTEEAIEFYKKTLGAKVEMLMRFKDSPDKSNANPGCIPANENLIMHSCFRVGDTAVMASDGMASGKPNFQGFSLSVTAKDESDAAKLFNGLSEGGQVRQPLIKTFFSPAFGMVADKFGVGWMIVVAA